MLISKHQLLQAVDVVVVKLIWFNGDIHHGMEFQVHQYHIINFIQEVKLLQVMEDLYHHKIKIFLMQIQEMDVV